MIKLAKKLKAFCLLPWQRIKVTCEGSVTMCCFQERGFLGNILVTPLEQMWNSKIAEEVRVETERGKLHKVCEGHNCPYTHTPGLKSKASDVLVTDLPCQLEIDLPTQHCNIGGEKPTKENPACIMCERHTNFQPQIDLLPIVCSHLKPYMHLMRNVHIQGVAEPFWKDRIFEVMDDLGAGKYRDKLTVTTTTNGTILTQARLIKWLAYPHSCITFSLDAATPETFKRIRRIDAYDKAVNALMELSVMRRPEQVLRIHNNINVLNLHEVVGMVELAAKARVDSVEFNPTYCVPTIEVNPDNACLFAEAQEKIAVAGKKLGVRCDFLRDLSLDYVQITL